MVQYREGKQVPPKQAKEYSKKKFSRAFVHQLEEHLKEFAEGYKTIPQKEIPESTPSYPSELAYLDPHMSVEAVGEWAGGSEEVRGGWHM